MPRPSNPVVRRAELPDVERIVSLFDAYRVFYGRHSDPEGARKFLAERLERGESAILLATHPDEGDLGFVQLYPIFSSGRMSRVWLLNDLFVVLHGRRRGVGTALLKEAATLARESGADGLELVTTHDNHPARGLYEGLGWERDTQLIYYGLKL